MTESKGSNLVRWNKYDVAAAQDEQNEIAKSSGGDFLKPKVGVNAWRFLPPMGAQRSPFVIVHKHFAKLPGLAKPAVFNCPRLMARRHCPVCAAGDRLRATGSPADYELAGELFAQLNVYANVIDRDAEEMGPQKAQFGKKIHEALVGILSDPRKGGDFTDPTEDGFDILITRTGTGKNDTSYSVAAARESCPLHADAVQANAWLEGQVNLVQMTRVPSDGEIAVMLSGANLLGGAVGGGAPVRGGRTPAPTQARSTSAPAGRNAGAIHNAVPEGRAPRTRSAADDVEDVDDE